MTTYVTLPRSVGHMLNHQKFENFNNEMGSVFIYYYVCIKIQYILNEYKTNVPRTKTAVKLNYGKHDTLKLLVFAAEIKFKSLFFIYTQ